MPTVYARTLRRAAELVGGEAALAKRLGVTSTQLKHWLNALAKPPGDVFLKAADIVGDHELQQLRKQQIEGK